MLLFSEGIAVESLPDPSQLLLALPRSQKDSIATIIKKHNIGCALNKQTFLKVHEWMAVAAIIVVMLMLTASATFKQSKQDTFFESATSLYAQNRVEATLKGAVVHSGVYSLPKEMPLKELLEIAELTVEADVRRFNLQRPLQQGRAVNVPGRSIITVRITGAVDGGEKLLTVPQGTRVEELIGKLALDEDADVRILKKKRKVKDGESFNVPQFKK